MINVVFAFSSWTPICLEVETNRGKVNAICYFLSPKKEEMFGREKMLGRLVERAFPVVTTAFPPYTLADHSLFVCVCVWMQICVFVQKPEV